MGGPGERAVQSASPRLPIPTSHTPMCKVGRAPPSTIAETVHKLPHTSVLFGSRAYGEPTVSSDVDLLVIMDIEDTPLHAAARISEIVDHDVPLDIIVRTPEAFSSHPADHSLFEHRIHQDGVCLYEQRTEEWIQNAEDDWTIARREMNSDEPIWDGICFHA